jgi:hypothetical protein
MKIIEPELCLIREVIEEFYDKFELRPHMLGSAEDVNSMFFLLDKIDFILKHGKKMNFHDHSWMAFLMHKGYIKGARNILIEELRKNNSDFSLLHSLRKEYEAWLDSKTR